MELMSIGKFAKNVGVSTSTLRNMYKENTFKPYKVSEGGTRYYGAEQLRTFQNVNDNKTKIVVGYCRVSTPSQRLYGPRSKKTKRLIDEVKNSANGE